MSMTIDPTTLEALLEDGPQETNTLATWLAQPNARVLAALHARVTAGSVKRLAQPDRRWALSDYDETIVRVARIERSTPVATPAAAKQSLRIPGSDNQKRRHSVNPVTGTSWWVGCVTREAFKDAQRENLERMAHDPINHTIKPMILGAKLP